MEYLDVKNSRSATEPSAQLSYSSTGSEFAAFFAKKKPQRAKQSLFKWGCKYLCVQNVKHVRESQDWRRRSTPESLVSSAGLNLPPMPLAWVPTWGSRGENSTAKVENYKVRMRRVASWWMECGEAMQMADEQQGCSRERTSGRIWNTGKWRNNKLDKVFFFFSGLNTTAS